MLEYFLAAEKQGWVLIIALIGGEEIRKEPEKTVSATFHRHKKDRLKKPVER